nr:BTAD domain-containing putative transcriptional regulator [Plantactinospora sp. KBS50]
MDRAPAAQPGRRGSPAGVPGRAAAFRVLGPLTLTSVGDTLVLPPSKVTSLLATLLLHPDEVVSVGMLQQAIWGDERPASAKAALQTCALRLRQMFGRHGITGNVIKTVPGGYRITATAQSVDLMHFRDLIRQTRDERDPEAELAMLEEALALWSGPMLANVPSEALHRDVVPRISEERVRVIERVCDLKIGLGRDRSALVDLWTATRAYPANERFSEQLIRVLYRTGRRADALAEFRRIREHLGEGLGVDPGPALRGLELMILRGDSPGPLALPGPATVDGASTPGGPVIATAGPSTVAATAATAAPAAPVVPAVRAVPAAPGVPSAPAAAPAAAPVAPVVPAASVAPDGRSAVVALAEPGPELTRGAAVSGFAGRVALCRAVVERLRAGTPIVVLSGPPGIGKTALAQQVAHLVAEDFPGGLRSLPMRSATGAALPARDAERQVLAAGDRAAGRRLLLLDDVADAAVALRLPALLDPGDVLLLTSRQSLSGLVARSGGWLHRLEPLDPVDSLQVFTALLGAERVDGEPEAAAELAELCQHLPLALRIVATRMLLRSRMSLAEAVEWLRADRIGGLSLAGDPGMSLGFRLDDALERAGAELAGAFVRLATATTGTITVDRAADLLGLEPGPARNLLDELVDHCLLEESAAHYWIRELPRLHAREAAGRYAPPEEPPSRPHRVKGTLR